MSERLDRLAKMITGACKSAFDAHEDETGSLHRNMIPSIVKRFYIPKPSVTVSDRGLTYLDDYAIHERSFAEKACISIEVYDEEMHIDEAERLAYAILWMCENHYNRGA